MKNNTLSVLVEDSFGVLSRIGGLFARRGFNIESLAVGQAEVEEKSRVTMVVGGDDNIVVQLTNQLYKLIDVLKVDNITKIDCVEKELMLMKIYTDGLKDRTEIIQVAGAFKAEVADLGKIHTILEVRGSNDKMSSLTNILDKFELIQVARTGKISLTRSLIKEEKLLSKLVFF
jgi:acetolactate synthase-1/3 small subunit